MKKPFHDTHSFDDIPDNLFHTTLVYDSFEDMRLRALNDLRQVLPKHGEPTVSKIESPFKWGGLNPSLVWGRDGDGRTALFLTFAGAAIMHSCGTEHFIRIAPTNDLLGYFSVMGYGYTLKGLGDGETVDFLFGLEQIGGTNSEANQTVKSRMEMMLL